MSKERKKDKTTSQRLGASAIYVHFRRNFAQLPFYREPKMPNDLDPKLPLTSVAICAIVIYLEPTLPFTLGLCLKRHLHT